MTVHFWNRFCDDPDIAKIDHQPRKWSRPCRLVIVCKNISVQKGEQVLFDEIRCLDAPRPASIHFSSSERRSAFSSFLVFFGLSSSSHLTGLISPLALHHFSPVHMPSMRLPSGSQTRTALCGTGLTSSYFITKSPVSLRRERRWRSSSRATNLTPLWLSDSLAAFAAKRAAHPHVPRPTSHVFPETRCLLLGVVRAVSRCRHRGIKRRREPARRCDHVFYCRNCIV